MEALVLSHWIDTNGQNARFVEAARKWGSDEGVLRALAIGNADPAGVVARFASAAEKVPGLVIREAHRAEAYFDFPRDILWDRHTDAEVRRLAKEADVIHLNNSWKSADRLRLAKPSLLHHHGSLFRLNPPLMLATARQRRMAQAVSTLDLTKPAPDILRWLPTAYDVDALEAFGRAHRRPADGRVRIVHAPTNRAYKATEVLIAAIDAMRAEGLPVDLVLVEGKPWSECMTEKAQADIVFDQLAWGYGCNAVEAWGMGIPVVSGADEWTAERMRQEFGGELPFAEATQATLLDVLRELVVSADARAEWQARGVAHVRRYHDELPALTRLAELYHEALERYGTRMAQRVAFIGPVGATYSFNGKRVAFPNGRMETTDPGLIFRLRAHARRHGDIAEVVA